MRLIVRDDPKQVAAAEAFVANGAWVSVLALAEATWVLSSAYGLDSRRIATAVEMLLEHGQLVLQDADVASAALGRLRRNPSLGYSDCLLVEMARKAGHVPLGTFDRSLGRIEGAMRL
ncbi:MAG: PIN domain-containing protein [Lysobacter sp.]|nr:PIN domain-containing protein [Lysobacter sp.]